MKTVYLIGKKLKHSISLSLHSYLGDYTYNLKELNENELDSFFAEKKFDGLNVTVPYKKTVIKYCDELSLTARNTGSVNTIIRDSSGKLYGYNTDASGFDFLLKYYRINPNGKKVSILGTGGSAHSVAEALSKYTDKIVFVSRSKGITYSDTEKYIDSEIVVNCTPAGMYPNIFASPCDMTKFPNLKWAIDLTYNPYRSMFLQQAEKAGAKAVNGLTMLCAQGYVSAKYFTGTDIPFSELYNAVKGLRKYQYNISLIGMPGCGKSTTGRRIAKITGKKLFDLDRIFFSETGIQPSDFISEKGEAEFRRIESEICQRVCLEKNAVISCGGGTVLDERNRLALRACSVVVYLRCPLEQLSTRNRPLSDNLIRLYRQRKKLYESTADLTFHRSTNTYKMIKKIERHLNENTCD